MSTSQTQLTGNTRTAGPFLLEGALPETVDRLLEHVSNHGPGSGIFSECARGNTRNLPWPPPPRLAMPEQWAKRSQATPASFDLMVRYFTASAGMGWGGEDVGQVHLGGRGRHGSLDPPGGAG